MPIMTTHSPSLRKMLNRMSQGMAAQSLASKASQGVMPLVDVIVLGIIASETMEWFYCYALLAVRSRVKGSD
jgi:hypothetical protein